MLSNTVFSPAEAEARLRARTAGSRERHARALASLAGGVSSGLRRSARPYPLYFARGEGASAIDVDGNRYVDYTLAWGPLILGHAPEAVNRAVAAQLLLGHTYGAQHDLEFEVAERLQQAIPCAERVAFANSGTEIVQVALRLARAYTGRTHHLKFEGHFHGWDDSVLVSYRPSRGEAEAHGDQPVPVGLGQRLEPGAIIAQWNDRASVEAAFANHGERIACVICEPLLCNSGCLPPEPGFLEFLKETAHRHGALLIFDEVITGFRLGLGGAQSYFGVTPDLATYAKAIGGGVPLSALAGRAEVMDWIAAGKVVHAGTLNGNPLALAAAKAVLDELGADGGAVYPRLAALGRRLREGLVERLKRRGIPVVATGADTVFQLHFQERTPVTYRDTLESDKALYSDFALELLERGVMVLPDGRWYLSTAHGDAEIDATLAALDRI